MSKQRLSNVVSVSVESIKVPAVDIIQRKFDPAHAENLAAIFDLDKFGIPVINHRGDDFWCVDGQHRIAALRMIVDHVPSVPCLVYHDLTDKEMADLFISINAKRKKVSPFTNFKISCTAGYERETAILRTVESQGLKVSRDHDTNCIGAVSAMGSVYDRFGVKTLKQAIIVIRDSYNGDSKAFDGQIVNGLGMLLHRYNGRLDHDVLVEKLSKVPGGTRGLLQRAENQRVKTGNQKVPCVAAAIVEVYNRGLSPSKKLPVWWRTEVAA